MQGVITPYIKVISQKRIYLILGILFLLAAIILSFAKGLKDTMGGDFAVFWQAGQNFFQGTSLYETKEGMRAYIYPPFAAMVFQVLALLPFKVSVVLFYFINFILLFYSIALVHAICSLLGFSGKHLTIAILLGFLFSFKFLWNNITMIQINQVILVLCLAGLYAYLKNKENQAIIFFTIAASIKIIPGLFLFWMVLKGTPKTLLKASLCMFIALALPIVLRGYSVGLTDLKEYYTTFLLEFEQGKVITTYTNQSLSAAVHRILQPSVNDQGIDYQLFYGWENAARPIAMILSVFFLIAFIGKVIFNRIRSPKIDLFEIAMIFITMNLLSGITWAAHLVTLFVVYSIFFLIRPRNLSLPNRYIVFFLWSLIGTLAIIGKDITGSHLHYLIGGYSVSTLLLILLFLYMLFNRLPEKRGEPRPLEMGQEDLAKSSKKMDGHSPFYQTSS